MFLWTKRKSRTKDAGSNPAGDAMASTENRRGIQAYFTGTGFVCRMRTKGGMSVSWAFLFSRTISQEGEISGTEGMGEVRDHGGAVP